MDRLTEVAIALAVTAGLIGVLQIWRGRFALGPFEWLLRLFTYARLESWHPTFCQRWHKVADGKLAGFMGFGQRRLDVRHILSDSMPQHRNQ